MQIKKAHLNNKGAAALFTVIIVSATVLIMAYSASVLGLGELELGYTSQRGAETFHLADGCMEEAMRRLRLDTNYTTSTLNLDSGSCIITVSGAGSNRTIVVNSTVENYNKKIQSDVTLNGNVITVDSWEELSI